MSSLSVLTVVICSPPESEADDAVGKVKAGRNQGGEGSKLA